MCVFGISRHPRGAALVIVMLVMAVLLLLGTTFLTISSTESQIAVNEQGSAGAHVLAEAAINKALALLILDPNYTGEVQTALGEGAFSITVTPVSGCTANSGRKIVARGTVPIRDGAAQAQLEVVLDRVSYPYQWAAFTTVPNGILHWDPVVSVDRTEKELWLANDSVVDSFDSGVGPYDPTANSGPHGNVGANGDLTVEANGTIRGNLRAGNGIHAGPGVTVDGAKDSQAADEQFSAVTPAGTGSELTVGANQTLNLTAGTYYYTTMTFGDSASLTTSGGLVTIYVTGPPHAGTNTLVTLGTNVTLGAPPRPQLQIILKSDGSDTQSDDSDAVFPNWIAGNNFRLYGILYGKNTDVYLGTDAQVYGSIIARTMYAQGRAKIHFDQAISNRELCHNGKYSIRRGTWREIIPLI
jgi:hypothetical protein